MMPKLEMPPTTKTILQFGRSKGKVFLMDKEMSAKQNLFLSCQLAKCQDTNHLIHNQQT